jgi:hypothetical protein
MNQPPFGPIPAPPPDHTPVEPPANAAQRLPILLATLTQMKRSRLIAAAVLDTTDREIARIEGLLFSAMIESGTTTYASSDAVVEIKPRTEFRVASWDDLRAYIKANDAWELVHKRISSTALRERGADLPPGVLQVTFDEIKFSPKGG